MATETIDNGGGQFVTFQLRGGVFALALAEVQEIIRMPALVHVPLSPPGLLGLANLRGTVMPVTGLREIFGYPAAERDESNRVVVISHEGAPLGLVVDRMEAVVNAQESEIESAESIEEIRSELLHGIIRRQDGGMVLILDPTHLVSTGEGTHRSVQGAAEEASAVPEEVNDDLQLVSFEVAGQEYALPIADVQEIVQMPPRIVEVPRSAAHVLGVMTLRETLLPLVSLRTLFGLTRLPPDDHNKIVVVPLPEGGSVGVVMDSVREVLRVGRNTLDPVPSLLGGGEEDGSLAGICRLNGGQRLVTIISAEALFAVPAVREAAALAQEENKDMREAETTTQDVEEQFVIFRLGDEEYGAPIAAVQEIVRVPENITRLPRAPGFIRGVVNLRGAVLPVIDQRTRFGMETAARSDRQRIMVFTLGGVRTGFIIDSVSEVLKIPRKSIGPAPELMGAQAALITRVANLEAQNRMILLIAASQLLDGPESDALAKTDLAA